MGVLRGITIKLPDATLRRLEQEARESGRSVAAIVRERLEAQASHGDGSVHEITADLAGTLAGGRRAATNRRRKFRRQ